MIKNECKHEWEKHTDASRQLDVGTIPATFICKKCHTVMTASEVFQLEALENEKKQSEKKKKWYQRWWGQIIIGVIIAVIGGIILSLILWGFSL